MFSDNGTLIARTQDVRHDIFRGSDFFGAEDWLQAEYEVLRLVEVATSNRSAGDEGV